MGVFNKLFFPKKQPQINWDKAFERSPQDVFQGDEKGTLAL